jgi:hypothetical protein
MVAVARARAGTHGDRVRGWAFARWRCISTVGGRGAAAVWNLGLSQSQSQPADMYAASAKNRAVYARCCWARPRKDGWRGDAGNAQGTRHKAQGTRHKAQGTRHKAQGTRHKAQGTRPNAERRTQNAERRTHGICLHGGCPNGVAASAAAEVEECPAARSAAVRLHTTKVSAWWSWCNPGALEGGSAAPPCACASRQLWGHANRRAGC